MKFYVFYHGQPEQWLKKGQGATALLKTILNLSFGNFILGLMVNYINKSFPLHFYSVTKMHVWNVLFLAPEIKGNKYAITLKYTSTHLFLWVTGKVKHNHGYCFNRKTLKAECKKVITSKSSFDKLDISALLSLQRSFLCGCQTQGHFIREKSWSLGEDP